MLTCPICGRFLNTTKNPLTKQTYYSHSFLDDCDYFLVEDD